MKYSIWKKSATQSYDHLEQHPSALASKEASKFMVEILNTFEKEYPGIADKLEIDDKADVFDTISIRYNYNQKNNKAADPKERQYYKDFVEKIFADPRNQPFKSSQVIAESKKFENVWDGALKEIKEENSLLDTRDSEENTVLNALLVKMRNTKNQLEFKELTRVVNTLIREYPARLHLTLADKNGNTVLHRAVWYARGSIEADKSAVFLEIAEKLFNVISNHEEYKMLTQCHNNLGETIYDNIKCRSKHPYPHLVRAREKLKKICLNTLLRFHDVASLKKYIKENPDSINDKDNEHESTLLNTLIVKMKETLQANDEKEILENLNHYKEMALEILNYRPKLVQHDKSQNTVLHRLFWYAITRTKTDAELEVLLELAQKILNQLSIQELRQLNEIKNKGSNETFMDNLSLVKCESLSQKVRDNLEKVRARILPLIDAKLADKLLIDFSKTSLKEAIIENILTDQITEEKYEVKNPKDEKGKARHPYFCPKAMHGHTYSYASWGGCNSKNPMNRQPFAMKDLLLNENLVDLLKLIDKTSDNNLYAELEKFIVIAKKDPNYFNNLALHHLNGVMNAYKAYLHSCQAVSSVSTMSITSTSTSCGLGFFSQSSTVTTTTTTTVNTPSPK